MKKPTVPTILLAAVVACVPLTACSDSSKGDSGTQSEPVAYEEENDAALSEDVSEPSEPEEEIDDATESTTGGEANAEADSPASETLVDGMRPDFKDAMDSYESFMNEYADFMEKYAESDGTDPTLLADYATFITKYADMAASFEAWNSEDLNDAELAYYLEVQTRVNQRLLEVAN